MSLGLQATKRRINSVNSTKKVTKAMQLVATAKLKTMKKNIVSTSRYADEVGLMVASLMEKISDDDLKDIFSVENNNSTSRVFLIITSTLGLCGGYNYNLFKSIINDIDKENDLLVVVGTKGVTYFKNRGYHVDDSYVDLLSNFDYLKVDKIAKYLMYLYQSGKCSEIKLVYTHYKNQITFIPEVYELFPFSKLTITNTFTRKEKDLIVEPNAKTILKSLLPLYLKSVLFSRINEAITSEYASRRNAMEAASDNAEEIVSKLQIEFNKARQAAITQEITEVVGGANAQN